MMQSAFLSCIGWVWTGIEGTAYWIASIAGTASYILFLATKNRRFVEFTIVLVVLYVLVKAVGTVI